MAIRICILYTSEEGQTEKIAFRIEESLKKQGFEAEAQNLKNLSEKFDVDSYDVRVELLNLFIGANSWRFRSLSRI